MNLVHQRSGTAASVARCEAEVGILYLLEILLKLAVGEDFSQARVAHLVVDGVEKLLVQRLELQAGK